MGIPDHLTCGLRNLYVGQEATVWTLYRTTDWFKTGKRIRQDYILAPCFAYMQSISCKMQSWMNHKLELKLLGEIAKPQIPRWHHPSGGKQRGTKEPLDEDERGEWKSWLKTQHSKTKIMASGPITSWQIEGEKWKRWQILFSWPPKSLRTVTSAKKLKDACPWKETYNKPRQCIKKQRHYFANKSPSSQSYGFSSSRVWMWELDHKDGWAPKNWCFWTVLEKTLGNLLDSKEIKPVNPNGNQSWTFIGRTDAEAPILWPLDAKNWLTGKDPDAGKD